MDISTKHIDEICSELDVDCYGKQCNFTEETEQGLQFYSRDYCYNISFRDLIEWYIPKLGYFDGLDENDYKAQQECCEKQLKLFMELIDIYAVYRVIDKIK